MKEQIRCRCPLCGMVVYLRAFDTKHKIQVFIQKVGGKIAGEEKGRGKAKGFIKFTDVTRLKQDVVKMILDKITKLYP